MLSFDLFLSDLDMFIVFIILVVLSFGDKLYNLFLNDFDLFVFFVVFGVFKRFVCMFLSCVGELLFIVVWSVLDKNWFFFGEVEVVGYFMCKGFKF